MVFTDIQCTIQYYNDIGFYCYSMIIMVLHISIQCPPYRYPQSVSKEVFMVSVHGLCVFAENSLMDMCLFILYTDGF